MMDPVDERPRKWLVGCLTLTGGVAAWFVVGIILYAFLAATHEDPADGYAGWIEALLRALTALWLFSPVLALGVVGVSYYRRRRGAA